MSCPSPIAIPAIPAVPTFSGTTRSVATATELINAIAASAAGDRIAITASIILTSNVVINKSLEIYGNPTSIIVQRDSANPVLRIAANNVYLHDFNVTNNYNSGVGNFDACCIGAATMTDILPDGNSNIRISNMNFVLPIAAVQISGTSWIVENCLTSINSSVTSSGHTVYPFYIWGSAGTCFLSNNRITTTSSNDKVIGYYLNPGGLGGYDTGFTGGLVFQNNSFVSGGGRPSYYVYFGYYAFKKAGLGTFSCTTSGGSSTLTIISPPVTSAYSGYVNNRIVSNANMAKGGYTITGYSTGSNNIALSGNPFAIGSGVASYPSGPAGAFDLYIYNNDWSINNGQGGISLNPYYTLPLFNFFRLIVLQSNQFGQSIAGNGVLSCNTTASTAMPVGAMTCGVYGGSNTIAAQSLGGSWTSLMSDSSVLMARNTNAFAAPSSTYTLTALPPPPYTVSAVSIGTVNGCNVLSPSNALQITLTTSDPNNVTSASLQGTVYTRFGSSLAFTASLHSITNTSIVLRWTPTVGVYLAKRSSSDATQQVTYDNTTYSSTGTYVLSGTIPAAASATFGGVTKYVAGLWYAGQWLAPTQGTTLFTPTLGSYMPLISYISMPMPAPSAATYTFRMAERAVASSSRSATYNSLPTAVDYTAREFRWTSPTSSTAYNVCNTLVQTAPYTWAYNSSFSVTSESSGYVVLSTAAATGTGAGSSFTVSGYGSGSENSYVASAFLQGTYVTTADGVHPSTPVTVASVSGAVITLSSADLGVSFSTMQPEISLNTTAASASVTVLNAGVAYLNVGSKFVDASGPVNGRTVIAVNGDTVTLDAAATSTATARRVTIASPATSKSNATSYSVTSYTYTNSYGDDVVTPPGFPAGVTNYTEPGKTLTVALGFDDATYPYAPGSTAPGSVTVSVRRKGTRDTVSIVLPYILNSSPSFPTLLYRTTNPHPYTLDLCPLEVTAITWTSTPVDVCGQTLASIPAPSAIWLIDPSMNKVPTYIDAIAVSGSAGTQYVTAGTDTMTTDVTWSDILNLQITSFMATLTPPNQITAVAGASRLAVGMMVNVRSASSFIVGAYGRITNIAGNVITLDKTVATWSQPFMFIVSPSLQIADAANCGTITATLTNASNAVTVTAGKAYLSVGSFVCSRFITGGCASLLTYNAATGAGTLSANANHTGSATLISNNVSANLTSGSSHVSIVTGAVFLQAGSILYSSSRWPAPFNTSGATVTRFGRRLIMTATATASNSAYELELDQTNVTMSFVSGSNIAYINFDGRGRLTAGCKITCASLPAGGVTLLSVNRPYYQVTLSANATATSTDTFVNIFYIAEIVNGSSTVFVYGGDLALGLDILAGPSLANCYANTFIDYTAVVNTTANATVTDETIGVKPSFNFPVQISNYVTGASTTITNTMSNFDSLPSAVSMRFVAAVV